MVSTTTYTSNSEAWTCEFSDKRIISDSFHPAISHICRGPTIYVLFYFSTLVVDGRISVFKYLKPMVTAQV